MYHWFPPYVPLHPLRSEKGALLLFSFILVRLHNVFLSHFFTQRMHSGRGSGVFIHLVMQFYFFSSPKIHCLSLFAFDFYSLLLTFLFRFQGGCYIYISRGFFYTTFYNTAFSFMLQKHNKYSVYIRIKLNLHQGDCKKQQQDSDNNMIGIFT